MTFDISSIARRHINDLRPYKAGMTTSELARQRNIRPSRISKLASNENPAGMGPLAKAAAREAMKDAHFYPDNHDLTAALADSLGLGTENIVLGAGSTEVLDFIARVFLDEGDEAVSSEYGFSIYATFTRAVGGQNIIVPAKDFGHNLGGFVEAICDRTKVIWIANPNNPTGTFVPYSRVRRFLDEVPKDVIVVLDEAYYEYLDPGVRADSHLWVREHPNLVVVRTFSKIHGLAGLRVGYGIAHPSVIEALNKVRQPCNVNGVGLAAALAALQDRAFMAESAAQNAAGKEQLKKGFDGLGLEYLSAYGNFLTVKFPDAAGVHDKLLDKGMIVRPLAGYGMPEYLRISVGRPQDNESLIREISLLRSVRS